MTVKQKLPVPPAPTENSLLDRIFFNTQLHLVLLFSFSIAIYVNTLGHQFVLDDGIVITENSFVKKGISGISEILSNDTFRGFFKKAGKEKLVSGGRYRPLSLVVFAFTYELAGPSPFMFHLLNIIMYSLLVWSIYKAIGMLLKDKFGFTATPIAFFTSLIFCVHPVHTECVANIKGLDEILALMMCMWALYFGVSYARERHVKFALFTALFFFLGMMSKENAISYLGIIPIAIWLLSKSGWRSAVAIFGYLSGVALLFIYIRGTILGFNPFTTPSKELMNNPFMKVEHGVSVAMSLVERWGIILHSLLKYLQLLIFPHPLTHDYYPKFIQMEGVMSFRSILSIILYGVLLISTIVYWKSKPVISFSIVSFIFPLILVSNIIFPIGTNLGERFLFMSSIGYCLFVSWFLFSIKRFEKKHLLWIFGSLIVLFSIKTIMRNPAWHDNMKLFMTDVSTSKNSAKIHNAIAGMMLEGVRDTKDTVVLYRATAKAKASLARALDIHPRYAEAYLQLGNVHYFEKNYDLAIQQYKKVLDILPEEEDAFKNMQMAYREQGRKIGMTTGNSVLAKEFLIKSLELKPDDEESLQLMGIAEGTAGNNEAALGYFLKVTTLNPKNAQAFVNLGIAYRQLQRMEESQKALQQAKSLDPEILKKNGME